MKSEKKIFASFLILSTVFILIGCGNSVPVANEKGVEEITDTQGNDAPADEIIDKEQDETEASPTESADAESTAAPAVPADTSDSTASLETAATPEPTPEPTPSPHVHEWTEEVTKAAGCASEGEKRLTCECGETKTEAIPATGEHNWEPVYQTVTHPSTGHVETVETQVQVGTSAGRTEYACGYCGERFDTPSAKTDHCASYVGVDNGHAIASTIAYDHPGEPVYETRTESVWVVDVPETTTQEVVGYTCSGCGATK